MTPDDKADALTLAHAVETSCRRIGHDDDSHDETAMTTTAMTIAAKVAALAPLMVQSLGDNEDARREFDRIIASLTEEEKDRVALLLRSLEYFVCDRGTKRD
jgi:hypothetical protein